MSGDTEAAYLELVDAVAGPPGGTCIRAEKMDDAEWIRRQWRNAIDHWKFWKNAYQDLQGPVPVTVEIRAANWKARAEHAEALLAEHGINLLSPLDGGR